MHDRSSISVNRYRGAFKIVAVYALISGLWIVFSDQLAASIVSDPATLLTVNTLKGWAFVAITALMLYWLIQRHTLALLQSEAHLSNLLDSASEAVLSIDADQRIILFNQAAEKMFGYRAAEIIGQPLDVLIPEKYVAVHRQLVRDFIGVNGPRRPWLPMEQRRDIPCRRKDGSEFPSEIGLSRLVENGRVTYTAIIVDITARKEAEAVIQQLAAIVRSSDDAIISTTVDGIITSWNPGAEQTYGYIADEVMGRPITVLEPFDRPGEISNNLARIKRGEYIQRFDTVRVRKDGRHINVSISVFPIKDLSGQIVAVSSIARDVTPRIQMQASTIEVSTYRQTGGSIP